WAPGRAGNLMVEAHDRDNAIAHDQIARQVIGPGGRLPRRHGRLAEVVVEGLGHVEEDPISLSTDEERDVLVSPVTTDAERIDGPRRERLAATIERPKVLTQTEERLRRFEPGGQPAQPASMTGRKVMEAAADVTIVWLVGKTACARRVLEA